MQQHPPQPPSSSQQSYPQTQAQFTPPPATGHPLQYERKASPPLAEVIVGEAKSTVLRSAFSSFHTVQARADERAVLQDLADRPIAQNYVAWRKSLLWGTGVLLAVTAIINLFNNNWMSETNLGTSGNAAVWNFMLLALLGSQVAGAAVAVWAALRWTQVRQSKLLARGAWALQFFGPMLVFSIPYLLLMDLSTPAKLQVGGYIAMLALTTLGAKVFGLFPGILRGSMTLKTLLPESSSAGWVGIIVAPLYALFYAVMFVLAVQISQSFMLAGGFLLLTLAPLVYVWRAKSIMMPADSGTAHRSVANARLQSLVATAAGIAVILIYMFTMLEESPVGFWTAMVFLTGLFANVLLLTVVITDLTLGLLNEAFLQATNFGGSPLRTSLKNRFEQLTAAGLTEVSAGEMTMMANLRDKAMSAAKDLRSGSPTGGSSYPHQQGAYPSVYTPPPGQPTSPAPPHQHPPEQPR